MSVFFNTRIEDQGTLALIGDTGLAPVRYLCNGNTVQIKGTTVHHVSSFFSKHGDVCYQMSRTDWSFQSTPKSLYKPVLAITLLIPGLLFSIIKAMAYFSADMRKAHYLAKEHLKSSQPDSQLVLPGMQKA